MPNNTLIMARDAGAAAALAPVARALIDAPETSVSIVAYGKAAPAFEADGLPVLAFPEQPEPGQVADLLARVNAFALVTGTSMRTERDDVFWSAARAAGIPSIAVLDHWRNYAERFTVERMFDRMPDVVAVMDEAAAAEYERLGCPSERIRVTGLPHLSSLHPPSEQERAAARAELGVVGERPVVVFASEPLSRFYGASPEDSLYLGYTETDALTGVSAALAECAPDSLLLVKLHPLEESSAFAAAAEATGAPETRILRAYSPARSIAAADVVTGMTSTFLLQAALMGLPAISFRPGGGEDHFLSTHGGVIDSVLDPSSLRRALSGSLRPRGRQPQRDRPAAFDGRATQRVTDLIGELARAPTPAITPDQRVRTGAPGSP